jgi:hypothetical protein
MALTVWCQVQNCYLGSINTQVPLLLRLITTDDPTKDPSIPLSLSTPLTTTVETTRGIDTAIISSNTRPSSKTTITPLGNKTPIIKPESLERVDDLK